MEYLGLIHMLCRKYGGLAVIRGIGIASGIWGSEAIAARVWFSG